MRSVLAEGSRHGTRGALGERAQWVRLNLRVCWKARFARRAEPSVPRSPRRGAPAVRSFSAAWILPGVSPELRRLTCRVSMATCAKLNKTHFWPADNAAILSLASVGQTSGLPMVGTSGPARSRRLRQPADRRSAPLG